IGRKASGIIILNVFLPHFSIRTATSYLRLRQSIVTVPIYNLDKMLTSAIMGFQAFLDMSNILMELDISKFILHQIHQHLGKVNLSVAIRRTHLQGSCTALSCSGRTQYPHSLFGKILLDRLQEYPLVLSFEKAGQVQKEL